MSRAPAKWMQFTTGQVVAWYCRRSPVLAALLAQSALHEAAFRTRDPSKRRDFRNLAARAFEVAFPDVQRPRYRVPAGRQVQA